MAVVMPGLERRLKAELSGDVRFDRFTRGRYATDASHYQIMPVGVVAPRTIEEAERAIGIARAEGVTVLARGGGTSQAGQTVGESLVVDCSKYLTRILDLDVKRARCTVEPGIVLDDLNRAAQAARPVVSGRYLDRVARHHRRHGRQQFLRRPLDALRHHARQRAVDRGAAGRRHARRISAASAATSTTCRRRCGRWPRICWRSARARADEIAARFPKVQRRVGGYNLDALVPGQERHQSRACAGRLAKARSAFPPASN